MSDEFCAGVQILLKRIKSNPEEFTQEFSPWRRLMDAVLASKRGGDYDDRQYLRQLTEEEVNALHEAFLPIARQDFDSWVMREVLREPKEEQETLPYQMAQGKRVQGWTDPRMNAIKPGSMITVTAGGSGGSGGSAHGGGSGAITRANLQAEFEHLKAEKKAQQLGLAHLLKKTLNKIKL